MKHKNYDLKKNANYYFSFFFLYIYKVMYTQFINDKLHLFYEVYVY